MSIWGRCGRGTPSRVWCAGSAGLALPTTVGGLLVSDGPRTCTGCDRRRNRCRCGCAGQAGGGPFAAGTRLRWCTAQRACGRPRRWGAGMSSRSRTRDRLTAPVSPRVDVGSSRFPVRSNGLVRRVSSSDLGKPRRSSVSGPGPTERRSRPSCPRCAGQFAALDLDCARGSTSWALCTSSSRPCSIWVTGSPVMVLSG
jgi:hypothetical protein